MLSTFVNYQMISRDLDRSLARKGAEAPLARETEHYLATISSVKSVDEFLKNDRVYTYAMKAFGLEDMTYAKGYMRKVLVEGVDDPKSFANRVADDRFKIFAKVFDFARHGEALTSRLEVRQPVVDRHVRQALEVSAGEENEAVRLAMYFKRTAPTVKNVYGLLADPALWKVLRTVFDFPPEMAAASIDKQAAAVTKRFDMKLLSDPKQLDRLIQRFTTMWDVSDPAAAPPILALFATGSQTTVSVDLMMAMSNLRRGG